MKKLGNFICKHKKFIFALTMLLLIPSFIGMIATKVNYDILVYLPEDIETIKGQNILTNDFDMGAFSITILDNMAKKDIINMEEKIKKVPGVEKVVSIYDLTGVTIPLDFLPDDLIGKIHKDDSDLMVITFKESTSDETTLNAIEEIKTITEDHCKVGGMSALVLDTMNLSESEITIYIIIAVILCLVVLAFSLDSYIVPILLLANIGIAILFNLGTNIFLGEISYITKALVAVLQLGVTTDFSIFLYHSYEDKKGKCQTKEEAMSEAINETFTSVVGSSLTTIAGFLVLCTMRLTLGRDLGLVMAKGVLLGVICVLTVFPSIILIFDNLIEKTKHKNILPKFKKLSNFIVKNHKLSLVIFLVLLVPAYLANKKVDIYYKLDESLPNNLSSIIANTELKEQFNIVSPEIILLNKDIKPNEVNDLITEIEQEPGIDFVLSSSKLSSIGINIEDLSEDVKKIFLSDKYQMILLNSTYDIATNELNMQVEKIDNIIKKYDKEAILAGEGPLMKDLITISDNDFKNVNNSSIICILVIMLFVLKSISLPILLITAIEFAIFINMSIPYFSSTPLPFVAPIVLGTIQLGATIDYAILLTTTYLNKRKTTTDKYDAMKDTLDNCTTSIIISGLCFFSATFGVGIYSDLEMISSLCTLISRGALISMVVVIFVLPSILLVFDKLIKKTTITKKKERLNMNKKLQKIVALFMLGIISYGAFIVPVNALTKEETVYVKLNSNGEIKNTTVVDHLINVDKEDELQDITDLANIVNINGNETFTKNNKELIWKSNGKDIFYEGNSTKEAPISLNITYYLDGVEKELDDLIGASGKITIKIEYTNKDEHYVNVNGKQMSMFTPFLVATASIIDAKNNSNLTVNNGKVINNGTKSIVVGLSTPGLSESLGLSSLKKMNEVIISYNTTKFELASIYSIATPKVIGSEDLNGFVNFDYLYQNMNTLKKSIDEIESGASTLLNGSNTLVLGINVFSENLKIINSKMTELENGTVKLETGIEEIIESLKSISNSLNIDTSEITNLKALIAKNNETIATLKKTNESLENTYNYILTLPGDSLTDDLKLIKNSYEGNENLIILLDANNKALSKSLITMNELGTKITTLIKTLEEYLIKVNDGATKLTTGTKALSEGLNLLTTKSNDLTIGANNLNIGINSLTNGISKFNNEGITVLNSLVNGKIKDMESKFKALVKLGENYQSFTEIKDEDNGTTKFIMVVNSKKVPASPTVIEEPKEKETFWTKIKNLFK